MFNELIFYMIAMQFAASMIFIWSGWCVFYDGVKDGVVGKIFFSALCLSAFAVIMAPKLGPMMHARAFVIMNLCVGLVGLRHMCVKLFWPYVIRWYFRLIDIWLPRHREGDDPLGVHKE